MYSRDRLKRHETDLLRASARMSQNDLALWSIRHASPWKQSRVRVSLYKSQEELCCTTARIFAVRKACSFYLFSSFLSWTSALVRSISKWRWTIVSVYSSDCLQWVESFWLYVLAHNVCNTDNHSFVRTDAKVCNDNRIWQFSLQTLFSLLRFFAQVRIFLTATFFARYRNSLILFPAEYTLFRDVPLQSSVSTALSIDNLPLFMSWCIRRAGILS